MVLVVELLRALLEDLDEPEGAAAEAADGQPGLLLRRSGQIGLVEGLVGPQLRPPLRSLEPIHEDGPAGRHRIVCVCSRQVVEPQLVFGAVEAVVLERTRTVDVVAPDTARHRSV